MFLVINQCITEPIGAYRAESDLQYIIVIWRFTNTMTILQHNT